MRGIAYLGFKTVTISASQTMGFNVSGSVFFCKSATAVFGLSFDAGEEIDMDQGWQINVGEANQFKRLIIRNKNTTALTVSFFTGNGLLSYSSPLSLMNVNVKNAPTYASGANMLTIGAGATTGPWTGIDVGGYVRKQICFFNDDAALYLQVLDNSGFVMGIVPPKQSWTIETSSPISLKNANGAPVNYYVGQIFYL